MFAAVHWYLIGKCHEHDFESFAALYTSFDAAWRIYCAKMGLNPRRGIHATRPQRLCSSLGIPLPTWALKLEGNGSPLSTVRNELVHQGLYGGEPAGFAFPQGDQDFDLAPFVSRVLVALLCGADTYTSSRISGQAHYIHQ